MYNNGRLKSPEEKNGIIFNMRLRRSNAPFPLQRIPRGATRCMCLRPLPLVTVEGGKRRQKIFQARKKKMGEVAS
jgi:hypothetical protein